MPDWKPNTSPSNAARVSSVTMQAIRALDQATTPAEVRRLHDHWMDFAREARVCRQIVEHMADKRRGLLAGFEAPPPPRDWKFAAAGEGDR